MVIPNGRKFGWRQWDEGSWVPGGNAAKRRNARGEMLREENGLRIPRHALTAARVGGNKGGAPTQVPLRGLLAGMGITPQQDTQPPLRSIPSARWPPFR
jgi:hypothetical protein